MSPDGPRRRRALFVLLALVFAPATATAEAPLRLPTTSPRPPGPRRGQRADVQNALDTLYDEHKVSSLVVYTADFDGCRVRHGPSRRRS
ncbi:hypothetical protein GS508_25250 [Rhodococcus hoagii]|nr:hypothetical protein [Prescottella equi]